MVWLVRTKPKPKPVLAAVPRHPLKCNSIKKGTRCYLQIYQDFFSRFSHIFQRPTIEMYVIVLFDIISIGNAYKRNMVRTHPFFFSDLRSNTKVWLSNTSFSKFNLIRRFDFRWNVTFSQVPRSSGMYNLHRLISAAIGRWVTSDPAELPCLPRRKKLCTSSAEYNP